MDEGEPIQAWLLVLGELTSGRRSVCALLARSVSNFFIQLIKFDVAEPNCSENKISLTIDNDTGVERFATGVCKEIMELVNLGFAPISVTNENHYSRYKNV